MILLAKSKGSYGRTDRRCSFGNIALGAGSLGRVNYVFSREFVIGIATNNHNFSLSFADFAFLFSPFDNFFNESRLSDSS
jgi:hypothetical protein